MFLRTVRSKGIEYVVLLAAHREGPKVRQRVVRYFGRKDRLDMEAVLAAVAALKAAERRALPPTSRQPAASPVDAL